MDRWQYKSLLSYDLACPQDMDKLNEHGANGWEVTFVGHVSGTTVCLLMRRPMYDPTTMELVKDVVPGENRRYYCRDQRQRTARQRRRG